MTQKVKKKNLQILNLALKSGKKLAKNRPKN